MTIDIEKDNNIMLNHDL